MFRRSVVKALSGFSLFMKECKSNQLKGLGVPERGKKLGELYRSLSAAEKESLKARAAGVPRVRKAVKAPRTKRQPSEYNLFVKKHMQKLEGPVKQRFKEISRLWQNRK